MENVPNRPDSAGLHHALATLFLRGYALCYADIGEIMPYYNYKGSPNAALGMMYSYQAQNALAERGVGLQETEYQGRIIYFDGNLPLEETSIEKTKLWIDDSIAASHAKKRK